MLGPEHPPTLARLSQVLVYRALDTPDNRGEGAREAEQLARQALLLDPDNPDALVALSMLHSSSLDFQIPEARRELRRAVRQNPGHAEALSRLAYCNLICGNARAAESLARRAIQLDSLRAFHYVWLSHALTSQGRVLDAQETIERCLYLMPNHPVAWIASILHDIIGGRPEQARQFLTKVEGTGRTPPILAAVRIVLDSVEGKPIDPEARPWELDARSSLDLRHITARGLVCAGYLDRAVAVLRECQALGMHNYGILIHDPLMKPALSHEGFQDLVSDMRQQCLADPELEEALA